MKSHNLLICNFFFFQDYYNDFEDTYYDDYSSEHEMEYHMHSNFPVRDQGKAPMRAGFSDSLPTIIKIL